VHQWSFLGQTEQSGAELPLPWREVIGKTGGIRPRIASRVSGSNSIRGTSGRPSKNRIAMKKNRFRGSYSQPPPRA
jgi:hypothetical protein